MRTGLTYIPTGVFFENQKQAVKTMGISRYRRALKERDFKFNHDDENTAENIKAVEKPVKIYNKNDNKSKL